MVATLTKSRGWLKDTYSTIGGSSAAAACGKSRYMSRAQLNRIMRDAIHRDIVPDDRQNPDMRRGTLLEPIAIELLSEKLGVKLIPYGLPYIQRYEEFAHARPDAMVPNESPRDSVVRRVAEIKVPRPETIRRYALEGVPDEIQIQAIHQMAVTGAEVVHFGILCPVTMAILHVPYERNQSLIDDIMEIEAAFYRRVMNDDPEEDDAPAPELPDMEPVGGTMAVLDSEEARAAAEAWSYCIQVFDEASAVKELARQRLISLLPEGKDVGEIPGDIRFYHREQAGRKTFDAKAAVASDPSLNRFYKTGEPFKSFRVYHLKGA